MAWPVATAPGMNARATARVKEAVDEFRRGEREAVSNVTITGAEGMQCTVRLVIKQDRDKLIPFLTNLGGSRKRLEQAVPGLSVQVGNRFWVSGEHVPQDDRLLRELLRTLLMLVGLFMRNLWIATCAEYGGGPTYGMFLIRLASGRPWLKKPPDRTGGPGG